MGCPATRIAVLHKPPTAVARRPPARMVFTRPDVVGDFVSTICAGRTCPQFLLASTRRFIELKPSLDCFMQITHVFLREIIAQVLACGWRRNRHLAAVHVKICAEMSG